MLATKGALAGRAPFVALLLTLATLTGATRARAADEPGAIDAAELASARPKVPKTEMTVLPVIGGSSDFGWGGGVIASIARISPKFDPFVWRLDMASITLARFGDGVDVRYHDDFAQLTLAHLVPGRVRIDFRGAFTHEGQLVYSGMGNASPPPEFAGAPFGTFEYGRTRPSFLVRTRITLPWQLFAHVGISATYNSLDVPADSLITVQRNTAAPEIREALRGPDRHAVVAFEWATLLDTRDDETAPTRGQFHRLQLRLAPGGSELFPYRYGDANLTLRGYVTPIPRRLTLAARVVGDLQFGDVPFYELARFEDAYALGGSAGVRGIPAQRYYGKVKLFGNIETRTDVLDFRLFGKPMTLGVVAFLDVGRLWFDLHSHPELDGTGLGLKYGTGGGLRVRAARTFVVRGDCAWSPDARPVGVYLRADHTF